MVRADRPLPRSERTVPNHEPSEAIPTMHVIHVDATAASRARVRTALGAGGATVTGVATAGDGLDALADDGADCLVCEHELPDGDARTLAESAREVVPGLPVVVYTAGGDESLAGELVAAGVDGYVPKPDGADVLAERVNSLAVDGSTPSAALRERKGKIERLHEVPTQLDACGDETEVCRVAVEAAADILNFENCAVRLGEGDALVLAASSYDENLPRRYPADEGITGRTYRTGETNVVADASADDDARQNPRGYRSVLSVPLGDRGVLQAVTTTVDAYDEDDAELAELLAAHVTDALERISFEAELRSERDRMAALFDNVPDPVVSVLHSERGPVVQSVNTAFEELFGLDAEELVGEPLDDHIVPPDAREEARRLNERGVDGELVEREVRRLTADRLREFLLTVVPVALDEENPETFGVYTDVTERKQRRERVEVLNRVLRHDLRNGMNIVRGAAELLVESATGVAAGHAETIVEQADELLALADRTRTVERAFDREAGSSESFDVVAFLDGAIADLRAQYPSAVVSLSEPSSSAPVQGGHLLELALVDVVGNAIVHNDRSAPSVDVDVRVVDDAVVVRVADDGPGIPAAERRLLTGVEEITQLRHASGLGLWMVNWAVTRAGGELSFEDNQPRGSVVTMRLPRADAATLPVSIEGE